MAAGIKHKYNLAAELIPSDGGVFEIEVDGALVFSKKATNRFPDHDEVYREIDKLI